jgi:hypothetical protein
MAEPRPPLTAKQILAWANAHFARMGKWTVEPSAGRADRPARDGIGTPRIRPGPTLTKKGRADRMSSVQEKPRGRKRQSQRGG